MSGAAAMAAAVDWSEAPEGATHYCNGWLWPWLRLRDGVLQFHHFTAGWTILLLLEGESLADIISRTVERPTTPAAWNGEGLPPVGTACEYHMGNKWRRVVIAAHVKQPAGKAAVFEFIDGNDWSSSPSPTRFRPIRTPEQIAAEEREDAIRKITHLLGEKTGTADSNRSRAEVLHDAGYRLVEGGAQ
ncbi:hypothetical protein K32_48820 [Kaistia sp. 32K]|uniref:hypothetical protein n=1 Tax=Kaistia sp. 32K TaxID=2795690 RepID=UPI0019151C1D|nr:hypothetical protein [Kaistia sp. 32K]BCP56265.1 hypothetical protein K32_48820 [Kaistia sp. 32K]